MKLVKLLQNGYKLVEEPQKTPGVDGINLEQLKINQTLHETKQNFLNLFITHIILVKPLQNGYVVLKIHNTDKDMK